MKMLFSPDHLIPLMAAASVSVERGVCGSVNDGCGASRAELSRAGWAVSRVLEELYWRRLVFHYLLFPAERSRLGHLITVYYRKTAVG